MEQNSKWSTSTGARYVYDFLNPNFYLHYVQQHATNEAMERGLSDCIWQFVEPHNKLEGSQFFKIRKENTNEVCKPKIIAGVVFEKFELKVSPFPEQECHYIAPQFGPEYEQVIWVSAETLSQFENLESYTGISKFWEYVERAYYEQVARSVYRFVGWCLGQNILVVKPELLIEGTSMKYLKLQEDSIETLSRWQKTALWLSDVLECQKNKKGREWERFTIYPFREAVLVISKSLSYMIENQKLSKVS